MAMKKEERVYLFERVNSSYRVRCDVMLGDVVVTRYRTYWPELSLTRDQNKRAAEKMGFRYIQEMKAEYQAKLDQLQAELDGKEVTFGEYFENVYLPKAEIYFAPTTFEFYENAIRKLFLDELGDVKIKDIDRNVLQDIVNTLARKINENEDPDDPIRIKPQTVKRYTTACRSVINMAVEDGVVETDPIVGSLRYPRFEPVNVDYLTDEDLKVIVMDLERKVAVYPPCVNRNDVMVAIGVFAGPRRGEMVALKWKDFVGLDDNATDSVQISISRSAYKVADMQQKFDTTKTYRSTRMFTIPKLLVEVLTAWREVLRRQHIPTGPNDFVIPNEYGGMVSVYSPTRWIKDYLEEHHLKDVKLHSLRHTFASLLLARGMDLCTVRDVMGHRDIETTEMYLHSFEMRKKDLMSGVNSYIQSIWED